MASAANIPAAVNEAKKNQSAFRAFADILSAMTDFSILKNKQMLLICIGNIFSMLGYYLPIMCLVSFAVEDHGVNQTRASFLLTIFGRYKKTKYLIQGKNSIVLF
jgi:predicted MFS family arabinose efflux permease